MKQSIQQKEDQKMFISDKLNNFSPYELIINDRHSQNQQQFQNPYSGLLPSKPIQNEREIKYQNQNHYVNQDLQQAQFISEQSNQSFMNSQIDHQQNQINHQIQQKNQQIVTAQQPFLDNQGLNHEINNPSNQHNIVYSQNTSQNQFIQSNIPVGGHLIHQSPFQMTKTQRKNELIKLILKHREIMSEQEQQLIKFKEILKYGSYAFFLATPLQSMIIINKAKNDTKMRSQLIFRILFMQAAAIGIVYYSLFQIEELSYMYGLKYMGHLQDQEILNFEVLYQQLQMQKIQQAQRQQMMTIQNINRIQQPNQQVTQQINQDNQSLMFSQDLPQQIDNVNQNKKL